MICFSFAAIFVLVRIASAQTQAPADSVLLTIEGKVETVRASGTDWRPAQTNQTLLVKDRVRTALKSRATIRLSDQSVLRLNQLTTIEIQPVPEGKKAVLDLKSGAAYFYNREKPAETEFRTPVASGAIRGTEFHLAVAEDGRTVLTLLDGEVDLKNDLGGVNLSSGEQAIVEPGQPPRKTAVIDAQNIIQWALYYPGVLNVDELQLGSEEQQTLAPSLAAYRGGDLLKALEAYPTNNASLNSSAVKIYVAALDLAVGQIEEAEKLLRDFSGTDRLNQLAGGLREVIQAVKGPGSPTPADHALVPKTSTEWVAHSYFLQSQSKLNEALAAAREATRISPQFGFAWERVAELEFSFGRTAASLEALDKALQFSPRNAEALSLKGFLLAAQNRIPEAQNYFDQAIAIDGALGNAWLGRGLCLIRRGQARAGRQDLQTAATLEPNRAILRSYAAKAFSNAGENKLAHKEIDLAKKLDPNDPTSWLYSALLDQQENRINQGVTDLEKSKELNDNRRVFRSKLLLDQDRAVRGANLASLYRDNGMLDLSVREASRAVNNDYANYSAHLFLAESYDALRDPKLINLRYETPWLNELLLANLLSPVGAGTLSQNVSQQEYSKLFERDRVGISSLTEYFSSGDWNQKASQFGTFKDFSYALDVEYLSQNGQRPNNDLNALTLYGKFKQQITPRDTVFLEAIYQDVSSGDVAQYYDQAAASKTQRVREKQEPILFAGYHHEWAPGVHTLILAGRLNDTLTRGDSAFQQSVNKTNASGQVLASGTRQFALDYRTELVAYTAELQQIWQQSRNTLIAGGRYQTGDSSTRARLTPAPFPFLPTTYSSSSQQNETDLERIAVYAYDQFQICDSLQIIGGLSYDRLIYPVNIDDPPVSSQEKVKGQLSPKAGFIWTIGPETHLRGYYTHSLGGVFFDTSVRLEPTQIAGFNQAYRSFIPESISGLVAGSRFHTLGAALDHQFKSKTYIGIEGELLSSTAEQTLGSYNYFGLGLGGGRPGTKPQQLEYEEKSIYLTINQLIGNDWSIGGRYRLTHSHLEHRFPTFPPAARFSSEDATLQQLTSYVIYNLPCGFFAEGDALWNLQSNRGYAVDQPGDDFWQFNVFAGYRFPNRHAELRVGLLNVTDRDYKLNPLTLYTELPRERTLIVSAKFNF